MSSRRKSNRCSIYLTFIVLALSDAASLSGRSTIGDVVDGEKFFVDSIRSILNEINEMRQGILEEGEYLKETRAVVEAMCHDFEYPVKTRLELNHLRGTMQTHPVTTRFRRDDKASLTSNGSAKDYMSTYYAQRKAIMEKYRAQQKEIMERLKKTKSLLAENKRLKYSGKIDSSTSNVTRDSPTDVLDSNITRYGDLSSTILPNVTSRSVDFNETDHNAIDPGVPISNSTNFDDHQRTSINDSKYLFNSTGDEASDYYSSEVDLPETTVSPVYETLRPFVNDKIEMIHRPNIQTLERDWPSESINSIPQNDVDFNLTEQNFVRQVRDNDTVIFNLGGHLTNPSRKNNSAFDQLEEMFLWDEQAGDEGIPRSNETGAIPRRMDDDSRIENINTISAGDRSDNTSQSLDSLRFMVEIKSSPDVHVTKNIKNVKSSTTTYRNSTHEIVEINGIVNSTKRIHSIHPDVDLPYLKNINLTNPGSTSPGVGISGGATESEWCEECPHDYRWGDCDGTLFYQHNIFLRNRGPSAIDAIFGMNVQGPVQITCVEAIRFNQTRGIVTLHSGGPSHDFAKLRIRGFQGEGFSYIMKVWGVTNDEQYVDGSNYD